MDQGPRDEAIEALIVAFDSLLPEAVPATVSEWMATPEEVALAARRRVERLEFDHLISAQERHDRLEEMRDRIERERAEWEELETKTVILAEEIGVRAAEGGPALEEAKLQWEEHQNRVREWLDRPRNPGT